MTVGRSLAIGTTGFALTSVAVYGLWAAGGRALQRTLGEGGFYAVCAVLFVALGSFLLRPLTRLSLGKFAAIFTTAFVAYAVAWCAAWFAAKGRVGEWIGSAAGAMAFCVVLAAWFKAWRALALMCLVLFIAHSAGYFAGGWSFSMLRQEHAVVAKLAWGLLHGLGMGAGLGYVFRAAQRGTVPENLPN
jgi:hypothetical protein